MILKADRKRLKNLPSLVASDERGNIFDIPEFGMLGRSGTGFAVPEYGETIPLPGGSDLHVLPGRRPVGIHRKTGRITTLREYLGEDVFAASAFLPPAYTALYVAAYEWERGAPPLPLFAYAPLGYGKDGFVTAAVRVDKDKRQDCENFDQDEIVRRGEALLKKFRGNRLTTHLIENCAFTYLCPAARNWVMGRWEAPVPVSMGCNSECRGCISLQPEESGIPSTQERLTFIPDVGEILEYTVPHLENAPRAVISFGQGCEGEPLTQAGLIEESVREIRKRTKRGTINLNTNASLPHALDRICRAGLDSIRVSMNSARSEYYERYFNPKGYDFQDVLSSVAVAKKYGLWVSINYFIYPGFTDAKDETEALLDILKKTPVDMIQMRNLNMDPDIYEEKMEIHGLRKEAYGIGRWMQIIGEYHPSLRFGYFNPFLGKS